MVRLRQAHEPLFLGFSGLQIVLERHLERALDRRRTVVVEVKLRQSRRHNIRQLLGKADRPFVGKVGKDDMLERIKLLLDRAVNVRVAVPEEVRPPRADNIEIFLPVNVL